MIPKLLSAMTGDNRYEKILALPEKGQVSNMCEVAERLTNIGKAEGRLEGENKLAKLMNILLSENRSADALKASSDENARKEFYREFGIVD